MNKFKDFISTTKGKVITAAGTVVMGLGAAIPTFAEGESGISTVTSGLASGLQTAGSDALSVIGTVLPYALPIVAAGVAITLGIRYFKKAAK